MKKPGFYGALIGLLLTVMLPIGPAAAMYMFPLLDVGSGETGAGAGWVAKSVDAGQTPAPVVTETTPATIEEDAEAPTPDVVAPAVYTELENSPDGTAYVLISLQEPQAGQTVNEIQTRVLANVGADEFAPVYRYQSFAAMTGRANEAGLAKLAVDANVVAVSPDLRLHAFLDESRPFIGADIVQARGYTGAGVTVAVLDTGIDATHPDLSDNIAPGWFHFLDQGTNVGPGAQDDHNPGHGTHVSGIITSSGATGPVGIAPDTDILAIKILSADGSGWLSDWAAGVDYVVSVQADYGSLCAMNMSVGSNALYSACPCDNVDAVTRTFAASLQAAKDVGITCFAASGNNGSCTSMPIPACLSAATSVAAVYDTDLGREPDFGAYSCGCYDTTSPPDKITCFSNRLNGCNELAAPGRRIFSTYNTGGFVEMTGTSMAAPHATAVAALMCEARQADYGPIRPLPPDEIVQIMKDTGVPTTDPCATLPNPIRIDADAAIAAVEALLPYFPRGGLDDFATNASFRVIMLDASSVTAGCIGLHDPHTIVGRSNPHLEGAEPPSGVPIFNGGLPPYPNTAALGPDPDVFPLGFPEGPDTRREVHTEMLSLDLGNGAGCRVMAGQPYWDAITPMQRTWFYRNSFGEVASLDPNGDITLDFPAASCFNMYVCVMAGGMPFFNMTPMVVYSQTIYSFPPDLNLPESEYIHDPSFPAVPLFDDHCRHVGYLVSAGHGGGGDLPLTPPQPVVIGPQRPVTFAVNYNWALNSGTRGLDPALAANPAFTHVWTDSGSLVPALPILPLTLTAYQSSGQSAGTGPDITNRRVDALVGQVAALPTDFVFGDGFNSFSFGRDGTWLENEYDPREGTLLYSVGLDSSEVASITAPSRAASIYAARVGQFGKYWDAPTGMLPWGMSVLAVDATALALRQSCFVNPDDPLDRDDVTALENSEYDVATRQLYATYKGTSALGNGATIAVYANQGGALGPFQRAHMVVFSRAANLGLQNMDEIDALVLSDVTPPQLPPPPWPTPNAVMDPGQDEVLFSLSPASPTLWGRDGAPGVAGTDDDGVNGIDDFGETGWPGSDDYSPADVFYSAFDGTFTLFAPAKSLGLESTDDIDALDIRPTAPQDDCEVVDPGEVEVEEGQGTEEDKESEIGGG